MLLRESAVASFPAFVEAWEAAATANPDTYADYERADLKHYHDALLEWSDANGKKKLDWLATIRSSMRNDVSNGRLRELGKLPTAATAEQPGQVESRLATIDATLKARQARRQAAQ